MKKAAFFSTVIMLISLGIFIQISCKKKGDTPVQGIYLKADLARHALKHELYYPITFRDRSIELIFSEELKAESVTSNVAFRDHMNDLTNMVDIEVSGANVMLLFHPEFHLNEAWAYEIVLKPGITSVSGMGLAGETKLECRTGLLHGEFHDGLTKVLLPQRTKIAIISDIHMGDQRAYDKDYCWFGKNKQALESFLDFVVSDTSDIRDLVICGDLFDEWLVPYTISPFDSALNINSNMDFFNAVAGAEVNENIFNKLRAVANHDSVTLVYVPGNHDMLGTQAILEELIPGIVWEGGPDGLGKYAPSPELIFEHGHRYDFFNCPQPLVNDDHILPPGYFVSRLYAKGMMDASTVDKSVEQTTGSVEFDAAWEIAFLYTIAHFWMDIPDVYEHNILMGGIDGYTAKRSFHETREMYAANIEDQWQATQQQNQVPVPMSCCLTAIWNGHSDLYSAAETQYMKQPPAGGAYKIVAFGHTHEAMLEVYPEGSGYTSIYANSGTWIDADQTKHPVRTYLMIAPKAWTGSKIDAVGLFQYNPDGSTGYKPHKLSEESID